MSPYNAGRLMVLARTDVRARGGSRAVDASVSAAVALLLFQVNAGDRLLDAFSPLLPLPAPRSVHAARQWPAQNVPRESRNESLAVPGHSGYFARSDHPDRRLLRSLQALLLRFPLPRHPLPR